MLRGAKRPAEQAELLKPHSQACTRLGKTINNADNYQLFLNAKRPELISARELMLSHAGVSCACTMLKYALVRRSRRYNLNTRPVHYTPRYNTPVPD